MLVFNNSACGSKYALPDMYLHITLSNSFAFSIPTAVVLKQNRMQYTEKK